MKILSAALLLLLCSAQTPQTGSLIHFADGSALHCTRYEVKNDLLVIYTAEGSQFTIRKSNVTKIEPVTAEGKVGRKEEDKMKVIGQTGVPPKGNQPSLAEASALYGNAKGGFTVLENESRVPGDQRNAMPNRDGMNGTNRERISSYSPGNSRKGTDDGSMSDRARTTGQDAPGLEEAKRRISLEECRVQNIVARMYMHPWNVGDPRSRSFAERPPPGYFEDQEAIKKLPPLGYHAVGHVRNGSGVSLCDVSVTIASDFKMRPFTVRFPVLGPGDTGQFDQPVSAEEGSAGSFRIDQVTCTYCAPGQGGQAKGYGGPPADGPKSTEATPLFKNSPAKKDKSTGAAGTHSRLSGRK